MGLLRCGVMCCVVVVKTNEGTLWKLAAFCTCTCPHLFNTSMLLQLSASPKMQFYGGCHGVVMGSVAVLLWSLFWCCYGHCFGVVMVIVLALL